MGMAHMTSKERVRAVFEMRKPDHIPIYTASISSTVASRVLNREAHVGGGAQQYREAVSLWSGGGAHDEFVARTAMDAFELGDKLDLDYVRPEYWRMNVMPTGHPDQYTFIYGDLNGFYTVRRYDPESELYSIISEKSEAPPEEPDALEPLVERMEARMEDYKPKREDYGCYVQAVEYFGEKRAVSGTGVSHMLPSYDPAWLMAMRMRPDLVERYMKVRLHGTLRAIEVLRSVGTPYLHGGGDFSGNNGPFFSLEDFDHFILPGLKEISAACSKYGLYHMFASDGDLWPVASSLFGKSGIHAYYEVDRDCGMDLRRLRETFPRLTLLGGISSATLHIGSVENVIDETRDAVEAARECGGVIVGCSNMVVAPTPHKNFMAMMDTLHKYK